MLLNARVAIILYYYVAYHYHQTDLSYKIFSFLSEIYSKIAQNSVVQARPAAVHFAGFDLGKPQRQILQLGNVSTEVQRMHIIPPQTKYFEIKYTKGVNRLV